MTDKVQKIKDWISKEQDGLMDAQGNFEYPEHEGAYHILCNLDTYIDSLQEEHVSDDFEMALTEMIDKAQKCVVEPIVVAQQWKDYLVELAKSEEPVSIWHDSNEEPNNMSHCLVFYGDKSLIGHYLHYEPVLYNKQDKVFVTVSYPHQTGYKVEQKSLDGGCVAEVYKNKRDRISISDITSWCYLNDLHNLTKKEEPVSEELEQAAVEAFKEIVDDERNSFLEIFKAGAEWKKTKLMAKAIDGEVGYWNLRGLSVNVELPHSVEEGDKVKVIVIKED